MSRAGAVFFIVAFFSFLFSCSSVPDTDIKEDDLTGDVVKEGMLVQLSYVGMLTNSTQFAASSQDEPLIFIVGKGMVIKGLEEGVMGMRSGESRTIVVPPEKGYGLWHEDAVSSFSYEELGISDASSVNVGDIIGVLTQDGIVPATVIEKDDKKLVVDLNHPLAGKTLIFKVTVLSVRPPTENEKMMFSSFSDSPVTE